MEDVKIQKAIIGNLKDIQELNLVLFKGEYEKYDKSLNLNWTFGDEGTKYFKDKISKEDSCALIAIVDNKIVGYLVGGLTKADSYRVVKKIASVTPCSLANLKVSYAPSIKYLVTSSPRANSGL
ncbi:unnamed protein product, partial [marine sediment metagenome]